MPSAGNNCGKLNIAGANHRYVLLIGLFEFLEFV